VVLLDIGLPGMNGYEVATALRRQGGSRPALVAITGYGQDADARRAAAAGFDRHLVKPVDAAELEQVLAAVTS
jgi:CheY-like chemotaxis protein